MNPLTYEAIAANVADVSVDGSQVRVSWKCPSTGRVVGTSTGTMAVDYSLTNRIGASVKRSIASEVIYGAARLVASLLGGAAGRVVSNAAYTAAADINTRATASVDYSEASRQAAVVAAFETVKASFAWDEAQRRFIAR